VDEGRSLSDDVMPWAGGAASGVGADSVRQCDARGRRFEACHTRLPRRTYCRCKPAGLYGNRGRARNLLNCHINRLVCTCNLFACVASCGVADEGRSVSDDVMPWAGGAASGVGAGLCEAGFSPLLLPGCCLSHSHKQPHDASKSKRPSRGEPAEINGSRLSRWCS